MYLNVFRPGTFVLWPTTYGILHLRPRPCPVVSTYYFFRDLQLRSSFHSLSRIDEFQVQTVKVAWTKIDNVKIHGRKKWPYDLLEQCCHLSRFSTQTGDFGPRFCGEILLLVGTYLVVSVLINLKPNLMINATNSLLEIEWQQIYRVKSNSWA